MAGDDEARARAVLAEMQLRISQGPTSALGIGEVVTPEEVRGAFLALTKQFHPARFGRLSPDLQKLANEVFLGIKGAHDYMLKVLGTSPAAARGGGSRHSTGAVPLMAPPSADGTIRNSIAGPRGTLSMPRVDPGTQPPAQFARGTDRDGRASSPVVGSGTTPPRTMTPSSGVPAGPAPRQTGSMPPLQRPATPPPSTPVPPGTQPGAPSAGASQRMVRVRTSTGAVINVPAGQASKTAPPANRTQTPVAPGTDPLRPITLPPGQTSPLPSPAQQQAKTLPPGQTSPLPATQQKPTTLAPGQASPLKPITLAPGQTSPLKPITLAPGQTSPLAPGAREQGGDPFNPPTVRNVAPMPPPAPHAITQPLRTEKFDDAAAFREAAALLEQKNWPAAVQALATLTERVPYNKNYRAWFHYAAGRAAYVAGRPDDAISEMQRALTADANHAHARHALTELQKRR